MSLSEVIFSLQFMLVTSSRKWDPRRPSVVFLLAVFTWPGIGSDNIARSQQSLVDEQMKQLSVRVSIA